MYNGGVNLSVNGKVRGRANVRYCEVVECGTEGSMEQGGVEEYEDGVEKIGGGMVKGRAAREWSGFWS